jgi:hypothetical protein
MVMRQIEYHSEPCPLQHIHATCEAAGKDGWQLSGTIPMPVPTGEQTNIVVAGADGKPQPQYVPGALLIFSRPKEQTPSDRRATRMRKVNCRLPK